jgi:ATP-dependent RNA helicase RhlE
MSDDAAPSSFDTLGLHEALLKAIKELDFVHPTPIQGKAIPVVKEGKDLIGCAATGTGKTAAFLLPIMHRLLSLPRGGSRVLVLEPTRELAAQVESHFRELAKHTPLRIVSVYGGVAFGHQTDGLKRGVDFVVATPGRLLDHMDRGHARFDKLQALVLDEADRMLDMGFIPDLMRIVKRLPRERQTLLFSATMPPAIVSLAQEVLRNPQSIDVGRRPVVAAGITHAIYPVSKSHKTALLTHLLRTTGKMNLVLVFARTKWGAERLADQLQSRGFQVGVMHGDRTQGQREKALDMFREGKVQVLVATDLAARGLDIDSITHVINYDVPNSAEDYVHRIGRTARAEAVGDAFTLVAPEEEGEMRSIEFAIAKPLPRVILPDFDYGAYKPLPPQPISTPPPAHGMHSMRRPLKRRRL